MLRGSGSVLIILNVRARTRRGRNEAGLGGCAPEVVRETGIHNTPISRSAATLSGVHIAADAPRPGCILGRNYGVSLARLLLGLPLGSPYLTFRYILRCSPRLGLVRTCHAATCSRQTQWGSYMAKALLIFHATRGRADAFCTRAARKRPPRHVCPCVHVCLYVYVSFLFSFALLRLAVRSRSLAAA